MAGKGLITGAGAIALALPVFADDAGLIGILAIEGDVAYGEYLSTECTACHGTEGGRIPPLAGLPAEYFAAALHDYREGHRDNAVMGNVAKSLGDEEIAALAAYFSALEGH